MTQLETRGVALALVHNRLESVVRSMLNTLYRTGRSGVINSAHDFSCCILTREDALLVAAESLPIHVMSGPDLMVRSLRERHAPFRRGDAFLHNSPYHGNSHAADHAIIVPVIDDAGEHQFTVLAKAHQADCGNSQPTTYMSGARDVYEEGALIFPGVRAQEDYVDNEDLLQMCRLRIRVPDQWWGDYLAVLGAARVGEQRLLELGRELGWDALQGHASGWLDYSEQRMVHRIRELPAGRVVGRSVHDPFAWVPEGVPVEATIDVDPSEGRIVVDLRDNPDCVPCGLNLSEATSRTSAMVGVFNALGPGVPPNGGAFRRLEVLLRENCAVGIPRHPASCSVSTTNLAERVANAVQCGMAGLGEGIGLAEAGYVMPPCDAVISGRDPRRGGAEFVNQIFFASSGGGGGPAADGVLSLGHAGAAGVTRRDGVEMTELRYPVRIVSQRVQSDTEGAGRFRGAPANLVEYGPTAAPLRVMYAAGGYEHPAKGARGGGDGSPARAQRRHPDGALEELPPDGDVVLEPGQTVVSLSCSGGGYGPAHERDPERVRADVAEGWISRARAREAYGVVVNEGGEVDAAATRAARG